MPKNDETVKLDEAAKIYNKHQTYLETSSRKIIGVYRDVWVVFSIKQDPISATEIE